MKQRLEGIRARCDAATPEPWIYDKRIGCVAVYVGETANCMGDTDGRRIFYANGKKKYAKIDDRDSWEWAVDDKDCANAEFIAHSRQDIPWLLEQIDRLTAENEKAWAQLHTELENEKRLEAERDAAISDIPHKCWKCRHSFCSTGNECNLAHYSGTSPDCLSWKWRGLRDVGGEEKKRKCFISVIQYGTIQPFVAVKTSILGRSRNQSVYCYDSRQTGNCKTDEEYADDLEKLAGDDAIEYFEVDPSAASFIQCLRRRGHDVKITSSKKATAPQKPPNPLNHESTQ